MFTILVTERLGLIRTADATKIEFKSKKIYIIATKIHTCVFSFEALLAATSTCKFQNNPRMKKKKRNLQRLENLLWREKSLNHRKRNLFHCEKLAGVEVHPHVDPTEGAAANQLALPPPDRRRLVLLLRLRRRWRRRKRPDRRRLREQSDSRFANAGSYLLDEATEASPTIVAAALGGGSEHQRPADRSDEVLHRKFRELDSCFARASMEACTDAKMVRIL